MTLKIRKTNSAERPIRYVIMHIPEQFNVRITNRFAELIPIVDEMMPAELWGNINMTTAKSCQRKIIAKRFRKKQWISEETLDLIDEEKTHGSAWEERQQSGIQREILRHQKGCGNDKERYTEDKCETIVGLCKHGRSSDMYKEIWTLIKQFTPKRNVITYAKGEIITENDDIFGRWQEQCEGVLLNMAALVPV